MANTLDLLLKIDTDKIKRPTKDIEIKRLSDLAGDKIIFTVEALTADEMDDIQDQCLDSETLDVDLNKFQMLVALSGIKSPDIKNKELLEHYKAPTPKELLRKMLLPGERQQLYNAISELSGYGKDAIKEVKN